MVVHEAAPGEHAECDAQWTGGAHDSAAGGRPPHEQVEQAAAADVALSQLQPRAADRRVGVRGQDWGAAFALNPRNTVDAVDGRRGGAGLARRSAEAHAWASGFVRGAVGAAGDGRRVVLQRGVARAGLALKRHAVEEEIERVGDRWQVDGEPIADVRDIGPALDADILRVVGRKPAIL